MTDLYWDPFDEDLDTDPYDVWRRMRDDVPVYFNERYSFYVLSRYDDVEIAHRDPHRFSSAHGTVLEFMGPEPMRFASIIFMDPPEHTRLRSLVSRAFTPRRMLDLEGRIREFCAEMLDAQVGNDGFDYLQDFGAKLPARVIAALLGVSPEDQPWVHERIDQVFHIEPGVGMVNDTSLTAQIELNGFLSNQMKERKEKPIDDLLTALVEAEIVDDDGVQRRLTLSESTGFANLFISAGTETVGRLLGWAAVVLAAHPDQRAELAADSSLLPNVVEELLRYEAPSPVQGRWLTEPFELHGETMPAEAKVLLLTGSAGRDDRKFPDPDRFDIHRTFDTHVSFGLGIHFCIGAALARLEGRVAIEETLKRFPEWTVDDQNAVRLHTSTVRGYSRVPINIGRSALKRMRVAMHFELERPARLSGIWVGGGDVEMTQSYYPPGTPATIVERGAMWMRSRLPEDSWERFCVYLSSRGAYFVSWRDVDVDDSEDLAAVYSQLAHSFD